MVAPACERLLVHGVLGPGQNMSGCKEIVVVVGTYDCMVVCLNFDPEQNVS